MKKFLSALAVTGVATVVLASCSGKEKLTVWVSESKGVKELTIQQIEDFKTANPNVDLSKWDVVVEQVSEADSATQMITDVKSGADIFCFAQDQLARLVQAKALNPIADAIKTRLVAANDAASIEAATVGDKLYCYPLTSDNGYYMYYDKSVVSEDHIDSLEDIIKDCEDAGKLFCMELQTSAWYNAAFFFATGCREVYTTNDKGDITACQSNWNSDEGVIALRGMQRLLKSEIHKSSSKADDLANGGAVLISGTWAKNDVMTALGENYAATDLPSFTVDGTSYHLGSFSGNKLMGVKPQEDGDKGAVCQLLAEYLTNQKCQLERFNAVGWGPSNKAAQQDDAVKADPALSALAAQSAYAIPQGQIHGSWWDIAKSYCDEAKAADYDDVEALQGALTAYAENLNRILQGITPVLPEPVVEYEKGTDDDWQVTGNNFNSWGAYGMKLVAVEGEEDTFESQVWEFAANTEFKVREGNTWDGRRNFGYANVVDADDDLVGSSSDGNVKILVAGKYKVRFVATEGSETITVIPVTEE
jgi:arabinogalactan oligomer/maltooligosaccharide transport system substrate-binding protein